MAAPSVAYSGSAIPAEMHVERTARSRSVLPTALSCPGQVRRRLPRSSQSIPRELDGGSGGPIDVRGLGKVE